MVLGMPHAHPGVTTVGVPNAVASLWANANSRPLGSPNPKATHSGPNFRFTSLNFVAMVSRASSQEMRCHLPSPLAPHPLLRVQEAVPVAHGLGDGETPLVQWALLGIQPAFHIRFEIHH